MATLPTAKEIAKNVTLVVTLPKLDQWRFRLKVGTWLIRLAAWVMWLDIRIED
jgi:hypothetical protein